MTERKIPGISVNKLAEFITANPSRRKQIVRDCKYPQSFKTNRYEPVKEAMKQYFIFNQDETYINKKIEEIESKTPRNASEQEKYQSQIRALQLFLDFG